MERSLEPELLDALPPTHPDALHNRRDLRLTNIAMGNYAWMCRKLPAIVRSGERVLEVGAGTGELGAKLHARGVPVDGLDLWPRPAPWPAEREWHRTDLRVFDGWHRYPVIVGNLILHQFSETDLAMLGERLRHARAILFSEPLRRRISQVLYRAIAPLLGANHVTLHDAHVSIAAGFCGDELPRALGFKHRHWDITCEATPLGAYRMVALRRS